MLKQMRDSMKYLAWTLWVVIAVFILFVFVDFGSGVPRGMAPGRAAATVGDREISFQAFQREYRALEDQFRQSMGQQFDSEQARQILPMQALNRLVTQEVLLAELERLDLQVPDRDVQQYILQIPALTDANGRFVGSERYQQIVRRMGYTPESFEAAVRQDLSMARLQATLASSVVVTDDEIEKAYREQAERASLRFVEQPYAGLRGQAEVSEEEIAAYFEAHREEYRFPERRVVDFLLIDQNRLRTSVEVSAEELQAYYDENQDEFAQEEQVRARHILVRLGERSREEAEQILEEAQRRIANGEDFGAVASEVSEDPGSGSRGGDLGFFGRGRMVPAFETAAFAATPGEIVGPVESQFGLHLIEVTEKREARQRPLEEVEAQVRGRVQMAKAETLAKERADALAERVESGETLDYAALAEGETAYVHGTSTPFGRDDAVAQIGRAPEFNQAAFDLGVGERAGPVELSRGWAFLELVEIQEPRLPELDEVQGRVRQGAQEEASRKLAIETLATARQRVQAGEDFAAVAEELGLELKETQEFSPAGGSIPSLGYYPAITERVLELEEGAMPAPFAETRSAILVQVAERSHGSDAELAEQREDIRQRLEATEAQRLLTAVIEQRRRELGVTFDRQLLETFDLAGSDPA